MEVQQIFLLHFLKATSSACRLQCDPNLIKLLNDFLLLGACNILLHNRRWRLEATLLLHNNVSVLWWWDDVVIFRILVHCSDKCSKNWLLEFNSDMWVNLFTHYWFIILLCLNKSLRLVWLLATLSWVLPSLCELLCFCL